MDAPDNNNVWSAGDPRWTSLLVPGEAPEPLGRDSCLALADRIGDSPETCISVHALRSGAGRAYAVGPIPHLAAAIVLADHEPHEPMAFGDDVDVIWALLRRIPNWTCVELEVRLAAQLAPLIARDTGRSVEQDPDVFCTLTTAARLMPHPDVRLLKREDADLYARDAHLFGDDPERARRHVLDGPVAAAVIGGRVVASVEA